MHTREPALTVYASLWLLFTANVVFANPAGQRTTQLTSSSSCLPSSVLASRSTEGNSGSSIIIMGSVLGGTILVLLSLFLLLFPIWRRRRHPRRPTAAMVLPAAGVTATATATAAHTPSRLSKKLDPSPSSPLPYLDLITTVRPVTPSPSPSPRRLAIDASAPPPLQAFCTYRPTTTTTMTRWDLEKASVHTPSGHPAITFRGNIFGGGGGGGEGGGGTTENNSSPRPPGRHITTERRRRPASSEQEPEPELEPEPSISSTFAAEMSSLLESISLKSSYSSLRSRSGGLGVPPRMRLSSSSRVQLAETETETERQRQERRCATTMGATRGSV